MSTSINKQLILSLFDAGRSIDEIVEVMTPTQQSIHNILVANGRLPYQAEDTIDDFTGRKIGLDPDEIIKQVRLAVALGDKCEVCGFVIPADTGLVSDTPRLCAICRSRRERSAEVRADPRDAVIKQLYRACAHALYYWPVDLDDKGLPKMRPIDVEMTNELRAACQAVDSLPRPIDGETDGKPTS